MKRILLQCFVLIATLTAVYPNKDSLVQLKNNGYEDIVIAISPKIPEDLQIIERIKSMVTAASPYMLQATKNRVYIRSVKILIPNSWASNSTYGRPRRESYDKADVIIADPFLLGDDPYTLQHGGCGEPGKYIHLTPNFLLNDNLLPVYGPSGRVFVHEWAHLRWGVFDEYDLHQPFYLSGQRRIEATRCPLKLQGVNIIEVCKGTSCEYENCLHDPVTGSFEEGCLFFPDVSQSVKDSIMYAQALDPINEFCDKSTHNPEAPNQQNRLCNYQSTWEVIMKSSEMASTVPLEDTNIPAPTFSLLQYKDRVVTLVLDVSGSMSGFDRISRMYQASEVFIMQIVESGSYVGIVIFSTGATVKSELVRVTDTLQRQKLKELLPKVATGGTNICSGVRAGFQVNQKLYTSTQGTELVLLTDGEDTSISSCFLEVESSGAIIHTVALGPSADKALEQLADKTGGLKFSASDNIDANGLIDAFSGITSNSGNITQQSVQLESTATIIKAAECLSGTVTIDNTVGNDTFFLVTWQSVIPSITLQDPIGKVYQTGEFSVDAVSKSARLTVPGTAERGPWVYSLCNTNSGNQVLGVTVNSRAADATVPPIVVETQMNADTNSYPNPMTVYAFVRQGLSPVLGAKVTAIIEPQVGNVQMLELLDNGAGADIRKNDGIYSKYFFSFTGNGRYNLKVRVENRDKNSKLAAPSNRALYMPGYVKNGTIVKNPPKPPVKTEEHLSLGNFTRTSTGGAFTVSNVPSGPLPDIYKPQKIVDLNAEIEGKQIVITWTATGDDLDQGNASSYDLRMSFSFKQLMDNFENATWINTTSLIPRPSGANETFVFVPENIVIENGTIIYFALKAIDDANQSSDLSNLARATLFLPPPPPPPPTTKPPPPKPTLRSGSDFSVKLNSIILFLMAGSTVLMTGLVL
ncbi:calcium-activated chloride channel regulator 1 [Bombina bombina]|uniref:calcium-activated chloride channel regulator 1 n=1 Tax=Bombina bombina TaxID=8345 RepID=UPI00235B06E0|nr:calcium-activated chloride channel regulator 1 [Bombina bombina]XP_053549880.1 calcium-activated chloride channel regulator 1 [Bombina bombina]